MYTNKLIMYLYVEYIMHNYYIMYESCKKVEILLSIE